MQLQYEKILYGENDTHAAGCELAELLTDSCSLHGAVITLQGDLGAGKTTLSRGFIQSCGYSGPVKSPTYTLIEKYTTERAEICHLDLYRLEDAEELEYVGFRDLLEAKNILLIEWPERVPSVSGLANVRVFIDHRDGESRVLRVLRDSS